MVKESQEYGENPETQEDLRRFDSAKSGGEKGREIRN